MNPENMSGIGDKKGFSSLAILKDQMDKKSNAQFLETFNRVSMGHPEAMCRGINMYDLIFTAPDYMNRAGIRDIQVMPSKIEGELGLSVVLWPTKETDLNAVSFKINQKGELTNYVGGEYHKVQEVSDSFKMTQIDIANEVLRLAEEHGLGFADPIPEKPFPDSDQIDTPDIPPHEIVPKPEEEQRQELERMKALFIARGDYPAVTPEGEGIKKYVMIVLPGGLILECPIKKHGLYRVKVDDPAWKSELHKNMKYDERISFEDKFVRPLIREMHTRTQVREWENSEWRQHQGDWQSKLFEWATEMGQDITDKPE